MRKENLLVSLVALYIAAELVSNATAGRLVQMGTWVVPGAIFLYSLTFTLRDAVHTVGGGGSLRPWCGLAWRPTPCWPCTACW